MSIAALWSMKWSVSLFPSGVGTGVATAAVGGEEQPAQTNRTATISTAQTVPLIQLDLTQAMSFGSAWTNPSVNGKKNW